MDGTIKSMRDARAWQAEHNPGAPEVGELAPDFDDADEQIADLFEGDPAEATKQ